MLCGHRRSQVWHLDWSYDSGVPQESVLEPVLFSTFVSPISRIVEFHRMRYHQYADSTQLHGCCSLVSSQMEALSRCVSDLTFRFLDNGLQLYSDFWDHDPWLKAGSSQAGASHLGHWRWSHGGKRWIKILGVHLDPTLSMNAQLKVLIKTSNFHICALRHGCRGLTRIYQDDRIQSHHFSVSSLLGLTIVTHSCAALQSWISANSNVFRMILRELCFKQLGIPAQNLCSNNYNGFESIRG